MGQADLSTEKEYPFSAVQRDQIEADPEQGIGSRRNPRLLLDGIGAPQLAAFYQDLGPNAQKQPRALHQGLHRLNRHYKEWYDALLRYYLDGCNERAIANQTGVSAHVVSLRIRSGVDYLIGCIDTDNEHAQLRGVHLDTLYEPGVFQPESSLDHV